MPDASSCCRRILILSFALGLSVDLLSGMAGLNTIAATATGFLRPALFSLTVGKDAAREGFMPLPLNTGRTKWLRYAAATLAVHCTVFFLFEAMTFKYFGFTLLRIAGSTVTTTLLVRRQPPADRQVARLPDMIRKPDEREQNIRNRMPAAAQRE